jgi:hypothetical protein
MLKFLTALITFVGTIMARIFLRRKPPKAASDVLTEESPTAKAVEDAEAEATKKFGPRD